MKIIDKLLNESNFFNAVKKLDVLDDRELTRALRDALIAEQEAIKQYETIVDSTNNKLIKKVLQDIANEERTHVFELQELLNKLLPDEEKIKIEAQKEIKELIT